MFDIEQKRQQQLVGRVEKIEVRYLGLPEDVTLIMNKGISTPYNCAQREYSFAWPAIKWKLMMYDMLITDLTDLHCKKSVLALVDGKLPWDIHTPLQDTCTLQLLRFDDADPHLANKSASTNQSKSPDRLVTFNNLCCLLFSGHSGAPVRSC